MLVKRLNKLSSNKVTVFLPVGLGDNKFCLFVFKESRNIMKALWKDTKFEFKSPLESDMIVFVLSLNFLDPSQSKLQMPIFLLYFKTEQIFAVALLHTDRAGSGLAFSL